MLCISIAPQSRQTARVDLLNASRLADLIELRIDGFVFAPDVSELVRSSSKPVIVACRRTCDGGEWRGDEEDREGLLRRSLSANPAWVELDLDLARRLPRLGQTKRLITIVQLDKPLRNAAALYDQAVAADADAVNFVIPMPTLDSAWPLLAAVSRHPGVPIVGVGQGACGLTFSLVSRKFGAPWIYVALERGKDASASAPTIDELEEIWFWRRITRRTQFVGVAGSGPTQEAMTRGLNAGFEAAGLDLACLPITLDKLDYFERMLDGLKIAAVLPGSALGGRVLSISKRAERSVGESQFCDFVARRPEGWTLYNNLSRTAAHRLAQTLRPVPSTAASSTMASATTSSLAGCRVLLVGATPLARALAYGLRRQGLEITVASADEERADLLAQMFEIPAIPLARAGDVTCDAVVIAEELPDSVASIFRRGAAWLKPGVVVLDISRLPEDTTLVALARAAGCTVLEPAPLLNEIVDSVFRSITGKSLPAAAVPSGCE